MGIECHDSVSVSILGPLKHFTWTSCSEQINGSSLLSLSLSYLQALWVIFASCGPYTDCTLRSHISICCRSNSDSGSVVAVDLRESLALR